MSLVTPSTVSPDRDRALHNVLALQRRVCLLRQQGQLAAADGLADEQLHPAVQELLAAGHWSGEHLQARLQAEEVRVQDAALLAEVLAPLLQPVLQLRPETGPAAPVAAATRTTAPSRAAPAGIADFIEDMLVQGAASRRG